MKSYRAARHPMFDGDVVFFRAALRAEGAPEPAAWQKYVRGRLHEITLDTTHLAICQPAPLAAIARVIAARLGRPAQ
jgi:thioesterase domain-containing protein